MLAVWENLADTAANSAVFSAAKRAAARTRHKHSVPQSEKQSFSYLTPAAFLFSCTL